MKKILAAIPPRPAHFLLAFILINLLIGIMIAPDYGLSSDEWVEDIRSSAAKDAFLNQGGGNPDAFYTSQSLAKYYGTAITVIVRFVEPLFSSRMDLAYNTAGHYIYFVAFQMAVIGIYLLGQQFFDDWVSLGIALLFGLQPLLFGHAFINSKDIPLLAMFLLTVALGFRAVDLWGEIRVKPSEGDLKTETRPKSFYPVLLGIPFMLFWFRSGICGMANALVEYSYFTKGESLPGKIFAALTTSGSLEGYQILTGQLLDQIYRWGYLLAPVLILAIFLHARRQHKFGVLGEMGLLLAAAVWGLALSTRVIALAAGGLVGIYALVKYQRSAVYPLTLYSMTAGMIHLLTWPYLWRSGFKGFLDALTILSDFPKEGTVLFEGQFFQPNQLPSYYIPKLMLLQFTESVVILALIGAALAIHLILTRKSDPTKAILLLAWLLAPVLYNVFSDNANYNNFRQYLFTIPPLFIFSGFTLQWLTRIIKQRFWIPLICLALMLPAISSLVRLHPYQYVYYNQFTGGVEGAYRQYDLDYWLTAYKETIETGRSQLPTGSQIFIAHRPERAAVYLGEDYEIIGSAELPKISGEGNVYAILATYRNEDLDYFPSTPVVYSLEVDGATLMVIKKLSAE